MYIAIAVAITIAILGKSPGFYSVEYDPEVFQLVYLVLFIQPFHVDLRSEFVFHHVECRITHWR